MSWRFRCCLSAGTNPAHALQITSSEVENALYAHPAVSEAVALGLPEPRLGEVVGALVSLREGKDVSERELIGSVQEK